MYKKIYGFSFIELIFVLIILAIILKLSIPPFLKIADGIKLSKAASDIASVMRTARSMALSEHKEFFLNFNIGDVPNEYWVSDEKQNLKFGKFYLPRNIAITDITFEDSKIIFDVLGRASQDEGSIYIEGDFGKKKKITLLGLTGTVKIEDQ